jgi:hypothetical protein
MAAGDRRHSVRSAEWSSLPMSRRLQIAPNFTASRSETLVRSFEWLNCLASAENKVRAWPGCTVRDVDHQYLVTFVPAPTPKAAGKMSDRRPTVGRSINHCCSDYPRKLSARPAREHTHRFIRPGLSRCCESTALSNALPRIFVPEKIEILNGEGVRSVNRR